MATAKPLPLRPSRRRLRKAVASAAMMAALILALCWPALRNHARAAASVGAHLACSCHYIGGRQLSACRKDFEPGMSLVMLGEDEAEQSVTARIPLLSSEKATFHAGQGCLLEPWSA